MMMMMMTLALREVCQKRLRPTCCGPQSRVQRVKTQPCLVSCAFGSPKPLKMKWLENREDELQILNQLLFDWIPIC